MTSPHIRVPLVRLLLFLVALAASVLQLDGKLYAVDGTPNFGTPVATATALAVPAGE